MTGVYDDVIERASQLLAEAVLEREDNLQVLDVDGHLRELLRAVGLQATQRVVDSETTRVLKEAAEDGFVVNRSAVVTVGSLYGELRVSSPYLRRATGDTARPVRDELGLTHGSKTPTLERGLTDVGIEDSFGLASSRFEEHYGWKVHRTSLLRVVHGAAKDALAFVEDKLAKEPEAVEPAACLLLEMDGCDYRFGWGGST